MVLGAALALIAIVISDKLLAKVRKHESGEYIQVFDPNVDPEVAVRQMASRDNAPQPSLFSTAAAEASKLASDPERYSENRWGEFPEFDRKSHFTPWSRVWWLLWLTALALNLCILAAFIHAWKASHGEGVGVLLALVVLSYSYLCLAVAPLTHLRMQVAVFNSIWMKRSQWTRRYIELRDASLREERERDTLRDAQTLHEQLARLTQQQSEMLNVIRQHDCRTRPRHWLGRRK